MKKYNRVPLAKLIPKFSYWREILLSNAIGQVFTIPYGDASYRSLQFIDWAQKKHSETYNMFHMGELEPETFQEVLVKSEHPILLLAKNLLFSSEGIRFAQHIERLNLETGKGILIFHEGFISQLETTKPKLPTSFFQYQDIFELHNKETTLSFLTQLSKDLDILINEKLSHEIYQQTGGMLWLVSACVRGLKTNSLEQVLESDDYINKSRLLWQSLPDSHKQVLAKVSENPQVKAELGEYGFYISHTGDIPGFLERFLSFQDDVDLLLSEREIVYLGKDLTDFFTKSERRLLSYSREHLDTVLSRDDWGGIYWGENFEESYSDWALDKAISRLREKLEQSKLPLRIITKKGEGYLVRKLS